MISMEHRISIINAGTDLINGSLILTWAKIAPTIKVPITKAAYSTRFEYQIPAISKTAIDSFKNPTNFMNQLLNPYVPNSSDILPALPPLYFEGLLKFISHTLKIPNAIISWTMSFKFSICVNFLLK